MTERKPEFRYSEIFGDTFQGEGHYTGVPTVWIRSWGCNFNCSGFGQEKPEDPSTWELDYEKIDPTQYKSMEELPVFSRGCDSSYSWAKKFAHLARKGTAEEITADIRKYLRNEHNQEGKFKHPKSGQWTHMAFTGGEPMMSQTAIVAIMRQFLAEGDMPHFVTIETNGTQKPRQEFVDFFKERIGGEIPRIYGVNAIRNNPLQPTFHHNTTAHGVPYDTYLKTHHPVTDEELHPMTSFKDADATKLVDMQTFHPRVYHNKDVDGPELFFSISPKLYLSGEHWDEAIKPDVVKAYHDISKKGQLKYVSNGTQRAWDEIERATALYREAGVNYPVWIMPVGADIQGQNKVAAKVSEEAVRRGYNVSARVHTYVFGNVIGK